MTKTLVLVRHGNTFKPTDTPVWVGARSDLPLVDKGLEQAQAVADALRGAKGAPVALLAGPLQRTMQTAAIIARTLGIASTEIQVDTRLTEIDYGTWEGKSTAAIIAEGHGDELSAWTKHSLFPVNASWTPSDSQLFADVSMLLTSVTDGTTVLVTSNGILRFFARAAVNGKEFPDHKVATGHGCVMESSGDDIWRITQWNTPPDKLSIIPA
jgi:probable phosphoglycerate mutase